MLGKLPAKLLLTYPGLFSSLAKGHFLVFQSCFMCIWITFLWLWWCRALRCQCVSKINFCYIDHVQCIKYLNTTGGSLWSGMFPLILTFRSKFTWFMSTSNRMCIAEELFPLPLAFYSRWKRMTSLLHLYFHFLALIHINSIACQVSICGSIKVKYFCRIETPSHIVPNGHLCGELEWENGQMCPSKRNSLRPAALKVICLPQNWGYAKRACKTH